MKKQLKNKKILFVKNLSHPIHIKLMESVTPYSIHKSKIIPKDYDVYIFEGEYANAIFKKCLGQIGKEKKIISLIADPRLYYLCEGNIFDIKKNKLKRYPLWRKIIMKNLVKKLDGAICMGKLTYNYFKLLNKESSAIWVEGFIQKNIFNKLVKSKPNLDSHNLLFIGYGPDYNCKGLELIINSFKKVKKEFPKTKLFILGSQWNIKSEWKIDGVFFEGKKDITPYTEKCSLGIHMGRGEAFGVNIPEMMLAGIPVIVSNKTGAKEMVERFDRSFIIDIEENALTNRIKYYFGTQKRKRISISKRARSIALDYTEKNQIKKFKTAFAKLIDNLYNLD